MKTHRCPTCGLEYECYPIDPEKVARIPEHLRTAFSESLGLGCGTPYKWNCPPCATRRAIARGDGRDRGVPFVYLKDKPMERLEA